MVDITDIVLRRDWQVREQLNDRVISDYVTATIHSEMPPIRLARVNGALMLVDGWHRLAAAKRLQYDRIEATVQDMTEDEACWVAAEANTTHGLPLKRKEKREVFRCFVKTGRHRIGRKFKSYRDMAGEMHGIAGKSTLQKWMAEDFPAVAARMSKGGPASTAAPAMKGHSHYYRMARDHLAQLTALAPSMGVEERTRLAAEISAAAKAVSAAEPWEDRIAEQGAGRFRL